MEGRNRPIVSNVPINKQKLRDYVGKDFYYFPLETYTDNKAFFSNRGYYKLQVDDLGANVDFAPLLQEDDDGVLFIIDEAHLYFNARNWKMMPQATLSYITTIRHVGDTLIWMCQKFSDIDAQIRGKTQAFHLLRNLEKEKLGWFKRGTGFKCYQYTEEHHIQNHAGANSMPSWVESYPFELKVAECYNTSLFNKAHDKKYKVKGIPLNYIVYLVCAIFICLLVWLWNGGFSSLMQKVTPSMVEVKKTTTTTKIDPNLGLPHADPFDPKLGVEENLLLREVPKVFQMESKKGIPHVEITEDDYNYKKEYWFGKSIKSKITFVSDKVTKENSNDFSFSAVWANFAELNNVSLLSENGIWQMRTPYFNSFLTYVRDSGQGANLKETDLILKENVNFNLVHGYELPVENSVATQGVVRSSRDYKEVGFTLDLLLEVIDGSALLQVQVENSDAMDITSKDPILQTFKTFNIIDVQEGMTYQIADFRSSTSQVTKGIFKKTDYSTQITNKIFFTYGNN